MGEYKNILFIRFRGIGDVLLTTPTVRAFRRAYPHARLVYLTEVEAAEALQGNPDLDEVLVYPRDKTRPIPFFTTIKRTLWLIGYFLGHRFDLAVDFRGDAKSVIFGLLSGARTRLGFDYRVRKWFYTRVVPSASFPPGLPAVEFYLKAAEEMGVKRSDKGMVFRLAAHSETKARQYIKASLKISPKKPLVLIHAGATHPDKVWPVENFTSLAGMLEQKLGVKSAFVAGPGTGYSEADYAGYPVLRPASLPELGGYLKCSSLFITNDGGPMHLAAALRVSTVAIFGGSDPQVWFPYGRKEKCAVVGEWKRDIRTVKVEEVYRETVRLLKSKKG